LSESAQGPAAEVMGAAAPTYLPGAATEECERRRERGLGRREWAERWRPWAAKSAWSLADQGFTALTGFCVTFLLARWMAPEVYGAYAIAFAGYLFVGGLHNVIVLEPMSVLGPARHWGVMAQYLRAQMVVHWILAAGCAALVLIGGGVVWLAEPGSPLVGAIVGAGVALGFFLFLFFARRLCYVQGRPALAAAGSGSCFVLASGGLFWLRSVAAVRPLDVFCLVGAASLVGALLVIRALETTREATSDSRFAAAGFAWRTVLKENWEYGRWLVGSTVLYSVCGQAQMFLAAAMLGLGAVGILRAMMLPASVMTQVVTAAGLIVLPGLSRDFGRGLAGRVREKAAIISGVLGAAGVAFAILLAVSSGRAEHLLFGGKFAGYAWLMPILALIPAANGLTMGYSVALRAAQRPHFDLVANAIAVPVAVVSAFVFMRMWGLAGSAVSMVIGFAVAAAVNWFVFHKAWRGESVGSARTGVVSEG
jgi:hypothetical protein